MKNFQNLFLVAVLIALVALACNKVDETPHVIVPIYVYEDVYEDAYYITPDSSVVYVDSTEKVFSFPVLSKIVFDKEKNISVRYLGGWLDYSATAMVHYDGPEPTYYPEGTVLIYDTVYVPVPVPVSYAILEVTDGTETRIDTAIFENYEYFSFRCHDLVMYRYSLRYDPDHIYTITDMYGYPSMFDPFVIDSFYQQVNYAFTEEMWFPIDINNFYSIPGKDNFHVVYQYPYELYDIDSTSIVFFNDSMP